MSFSKSKTITIGLMILVNPIILNLVYYLSKDNLLSLAIYLIVGFYLVPWIISKVIDENLYSILTFKKLGDMFSSLSKFYKYVSLVLYLGTFLLVFGAIYLKLCPGLTNINLLSPKLKYEILSILY